MLALNESMSKKSLSRNSSKLGTRSKSLGSLNRKSKLLPELVIDKKEPNTK